MPPNWAQIVSAVAAAAALAIATFAWRTNVRTYRGSFRPVVRPVPARHPNGTINNGRLILKNIGRGPAISVSLVEPPPPPGEQWPLTHPGPIVTTVDVVEPLGAPQGGGESTRIGRIALDIPPLRVLRRNATYHLFYQDLAGSWHETTFEFDDSEAMTARHFGRRWWPPDAVPREVAEAAQIVRDSA